MDALAELQALIARHCPASHGMAETAIAGLTLLRSEVAAATATQVVYQPMVCLIAQGKKRVMLADEVLEYDAAKYLVSSLELPVSGCVIEATAERPYLALSLALDPEVLCAIAEQMPASADGRTTSRGLAVTALDQELLESFVRLLRLLDRPEQVDLLAPLIEREILYRLLMGEQASMLRGMALRDGRMRQVVRAANWLRENYARPFEMGALARVARMSEPSLHRHFKAVTAMSPLQYQKRIRLQVARERLAGDAATVAFSVDYASPSQFSREYGRHFGKPPRQDTRQRHGAE